MRTEATLNDDIDTAPEQDLKFFDHRKVIRESTVLRHVDQKIDITIRPFLAASRRAKQAYIRHAMSVRNRANGVAATMHLFAQGHDANISQLGSRTGILADHLRCERGT